MQVQSLNSIAQPYNRAKASKAAGGFGFSGPFVAGLSSTFSAVHASRIREMFIEDFLGFGVLRTVIDLFRPYIYKKSLKNKREINVPAARERFIRESLSILTDCVIGGVVAAGVGGAANVVRKTSNISNQFLSNETLGLFKGLVDKSPNSRIFMNQLANEIAFSPEQAKPIYQIISKAVQANKGSAFEDAAVEIVKRFKADKSTLDVVIGKNTFALDELLGDAAKFSKGMTEKKAWGDGAKAILKETAKVNRFRLFTGLGVAFAATLLVPYMNNILTRRVDFLKDYPAEKGLKELRKVKAGEKESFFQKYMPYLYDSAKAGKVMPFVFSAVPLFLFFGIDTAKLSSGQWRQGLMSFGKGYWKRLGNILQFGKGFPYTTQQQMASGYAILIFSRLLSSRGPNEFRERFIDSLALGWTLWILGTPLMKRLVASKIDPKLLKSLATNPNVKVLKREVEITRLLENVQGKNAVNELLLKKAAKSTLGKYKLLSFFALLSTIGLLGILEPIVAIKWTEYWAYKDNYLSKLRAKERNAKNTQPTPAPQVDAPVSVSIPQAVPVIKPVTPFVTAANFQQSQQQMPFYMAPSSPFVKQ